jgi:hypothetical protein
MVDYGTASIAREFGAYGLIEFFAMDEQMPGGITFPFFNVICKKSDL